MNFLTGGFPFIVNPNLTALPGAPVPFEDAVTTLPIAARLHHLGPVGVSHGPHERSLHPTPSSTCRASRRISPRSTPGHQPQPLSVFGMAPNIRNGYIGSYTAGIEQTLKDVVLSASYVATAGVKLRSVTSPNSYSRRLAPVRALHAVQLPGPDHGRLRSGVPHGDHLPTPLTTPSRFPPPRTPRAWDWAFNPATPSANRSTIPAPSSPASAEPTGTIIQASPAGPLESRGRQRALNL